MTSNNNSLKIAFCDIGGDSWTGGMTYRRNLLKSLKLYDQNIEIYLFKDNKNISVYENEYDGVYLLKTQKLPILNTVFKLFKSSLMLDIQMGQLIRKVFPKLDALFPHSFRTGTKVPSIMWIPDFQIMYLPDLYTSQQVKSFPTVMRKALKSTPMVILSSEDAQNDLKKFFPEYAGKSRILRFVAHVPKNLYDIKPQDIIKKYNIPERYIYVPNQFWAHKNHILLLDAMNILKQRGVRPFVVFSGNPIDNRRPKHLLDVFHRINLYGLREQVAILGFIEHEDIYSLIRQSVCVLNPSLFEGWSTTVEEAKSVGKAMLLSNLPVHIEQNPPKSLYFDRHSVEDLADKLGTIWQEWPHGSSFDLEKQAREILPQRMKDFGSSFIQYVKEAVQIYRN